MKWLDKKIEEVISVIIHSEDYQICLKLREKMEKNFELMQLIDTLKKRQREYVRQGSCSEEALEAILKELHEIPIYVLYMQHLEKVNQMISYVEEELNDYFYQLCN